MPSEEVITVASIAGFAREPIAICAWPGAAQFGAQRLALFNSEALVTRLGLRPGLVLIA